MIDVFFTWADLPPKIFGCVVPNPDFSYQIYLNKMLSPAKTHKTIEHEITHALENHFDDLRSVADIEYEVNRVIGR